MPQVFCGPDIACCLFEGPVEMRELIGTMEEILDSGPHVRVLYDLRLADLQKFSRQEVEDFAQFLRQRWPRREPGKAALVASRDLEYGLARMLQVHLEDMPFHLQVFRTLKEAAAWLRKD